MHFQAGVRLSGVYSLLPCGAIFKSDTSLHPYQQYIQARGYA